MQNFVKKKIEKKNMNKTSGEQIIKTLSSVINVATDIPMDFQMF